MKVKRYSIKDPNIQTGNRKVGTSSFDNNIQKSAPAFKTALVDEIRTNIQIELNELLADIEQKGKNFALKPNIENLNAYKQSVKQFLWQATRKTYRVTSILGRRLDYKVVDTINEKLESLSYEIIAKEESHLMLVDRIDEIRGLLIDLLL